MELKTGYEWCLENRIRPVDLSQWVGSKSFSVKNFYEEKINHIVFMERIQKCEVKPNSNPIKTEMFLEYRMYGLVTKNISPLQQGIQFSHAVVEYQQCTKNIPPFEKIYNKWAMFDKSFVILNGGTTCDLPENLGTMQKHIKKLEENGVLVAKYYEPNLNNALTAIAFLVDERVYKKDVYPDFSENQWFRTYYEDHNDYIERIGGLGNEFLREFLSTLKVL